MSAADIHNITLLGYCDGGKTTLVEAIAHHFGVTSRQGTVQDGNTLTDFSPEEKEKKHSLSAGVVHFETKLGRMNIIDTPGYPDFEADAITSMGAAGTAAIVVGARETGVPFHTLNLWKKAGATGLARAVVVTKLDGDNLNLDSVISNIRETFGQRVVPFTLANGTGPAFTAVIEDTGGDNPYHSDLVDAIVEADDDLMERYLEDGEISMEELEKAIPTAMAKGTFAPLFCVDPVRGIGIPEFAEFMLRDFPTAAMQFKAMHSDNVEDGLATSRVVARVWKVVSDQHLGQVTYLRILQGTVTPEISLHDPHVNKPIKANGLSYIVGKDLIPISKAEPGDIVAVTRIDDLEVGDVLVSEGDAKKHQFPLPRPFFSLAVSPRSRADEQKISGELQKAAKEDPCFFVKRDPATKELIAMGLSELHLSTILHRIESRGVGVETKLPRIAYKETITAKADGHHRHKKQTGGSGQFGECYIRIAPTMRGDGFSFVNGVVGGSIPRQYIPAVEKGVMEQMGLGIIAKSEVVDLTVEVYDGKFHAVDSDELSFKTAGRIALRDAFLKANPILLEPIMNVEITVPSRFFGDVSGDLNTRRGQILGMEADGDFQTIQAEVPLAELLTYGTILRSMSHGEGSFSMEFSRYDQVPSHLQEKVVSAIQDEE
ncbi:MAG: elongation factor G [Planctomycetes bacterium]|nr:elongation factor G [Planctomycetota bacterium]